MELIQSRISDVWIPLRSYPTLISKIVSEEALSSPRRSSLLRISISIMAETYSFSDCSNNNSCDHSTLYPTFVASIQGLGIVNLSFNWIVLSSIILPPPNQDRTIFCAICVCGPAAGPSGVEAFLPLKMTV